MVGHFPVEVNRNDEPILLAGAAAASSKPAKMRAFYSGTDTLAVPVNSRPDPAEWSKGWIHAIYGDAEGTTNIFRNYWSNQATGLINDVPGEIMLSPNLWGEVKLEAAP